MNTTWKDALLGFVVGAGVYVTLTLLVLRDFPGSRGPYLALLVSLMAAQLYRLEKRVERLQLRLDKSDGA